MGNKNKVSHTILNARTIEFDWHLYEIPNDTQNLQNKVQFLRMTEQYAELDRMHKDLHR